MIEIVKIKQRLLNYGIEELQKVVYSIILSDQSSNIYSQISPLLGRLLRLIINLLTVEELVSLSELSNKELTEYFEKLFEWK